MISVWENGVISVEESTSVWIFIWECISVSVRLLVTVSSASSVIWVVSSHIFLLFPSKWEEYLQETQSGTGSSSWDLQSSQFYGQFISVKSYSKINL